MPDTIAPNAAIPNPALEPFHVIIGEWRTEGTHPMLPGETFHGRTSFEWIEGGAFITMRSEFDNARIPQSIAIFASDNTKDELFMIYFDSRSVSRKCDLTIEGNVWTWSRTAPEFSQRYTFTLADNGNTMTGKGEMSKDGVKWEEDLGVVYRRGRK